MSTLPSNEEAARFMAERRGNLQAAQGAAAYRAMPTYQQQASEQEIIRAAEQQPRIEAQPVSQELPISQDAIEIMARHNINRRELEEAYRIMNMLNERLDVRGALNITIDDAVRIYKNMPMYNQNLNIPSEQVSMINDATWNALSGDRINVTDSRGQEI